MSFETFTPIRFHINENEKKLAKRQNVKFHNSLNNCRDLLQAYMYACIFWSESVVYFKRSCPLKFSSTIWCVTTVRLRDDSSSAVQ